MFLLDTCAFSDFIKGETNTIKQIKALSPRNLFMSTISVYEVFYGLEKNKAFSKKHNHIINSFVNQINTLEFSKTTAMIAADIRYQLSSSGKIIGPYDLLIAATALEHELTLVSSNINELARVPNIRLINWRNNNH